MLERILDGLIDVLQEYWLAIILGLFAVYLLLYSNDVGKEVDDLYLEIQSLEETLANAKGVERNVSADIDKEGEKKVIEERTVSAQQIAEEYIKVDDALTEFYKSNKDMPVDDDEAMKEIMDKLNWAKEENTRLTGAGDADHIKTWQLNPEWTLKLESVVMYKNTERIPVIFSMTTKDGKNAGLVKAMFNVDKYKLTDIEKYYTVDGMRDEVNVGGS